MAFWSGTDDNDDKRDRFSMVIGKIEKLIPEYKMRFSCGKQRYDFDLDDVFDGDGEACVFDLDKAISKIHVRTFKVADDTSLNMFPLACGMRQNEGYTPGYSDNGSLYNMIKSNLKSKREFTIQELFGEDW